jgi:hypothetical protein
MRAFALTAYVPSGIVRAKDSSGGAIADELLVLPYEEPVVQLVERFLSARIEGSGAEAFVASSALREFGPRLELQPLYATRDGRAYTAFAILFISGGGDSYSVGVRLAVDGRQPVEETLGVGRAASQDGKVRLPRQRWHPGTHRAVGVVGGGRSNVHRTRSLVGLKCGYTGSGFRVAREP